MSFNFSTVDSTIIANSREHSAPAPPYEPVATAIIDNGMPTSSAAKQHAEPPALGQVDDLPSSYSYIDHVIWPVYTDDGTGPDLIEVELAKYKAWLDSHINTGPSINTAVANEQGSASAPDRHH
jgi:hypothetical protein